MRKRKVDPKYIVRVHLGDAANHPVEIIDGDVPPRWRGEEAYYTTPSGKTIVRHPSSYGWRTVYHHSTLHIVVGKKWLDRHQCTSVTTDDGSTCILADYSREYLHGYHVWRGWYRFREMTMVLTPDDQTIHLHAAMKPVEAVKEAIKIIRNRKAEKRFADHPEDVWVSIDDSYNSGNCKYMTDVFATDYLRKIGAVGPVCTRADLLLSIRDDIFTRRAVNYAASRMV